MSTAYAVWSGVGTAAVALIGALWLGESWDPIKVIGLGLIVGGVVMLLGLIMSIVMIVWLASDSQPGPNRFGPSPK